MLFRSASGQILAAEEPEQQHIALKPRQRLAIDQPFAERPGIAAAGCPANLLEIGLEPCNLLGPNHSARRGKLPELSNRGHGFLICDV